MRWVFPRSFVLLSLALGVALRLVVALRMPIIEHDGAMYASLAAAMLRGEWVYGLSPFWPPLYPLTIAGVASLPHAFGVAITPSLLETCARAVSLVCAVAMLAPLYWIGHRLLGRRGAQWALLFVLFHPRLVQFSAAALSESAFTLTIVAGLAALMAAWRIEPQSGERPTREVAPQPFDADGRNRAARRPPLLVLELVAGVAFGLGYLVRPEALLIAAALWALGATIRRGEGIRKRLSPTFLIGVLAISTPFMIFLHGELGYWSIGEKGPYNFWREFRSEYATLYPEPEGLNERASESPELVAAISPRPVHVVGFIVRRPGAFLLRYARNLATITVSTFPVAVYHVFLLLALLGLIGISGRRWWPVLAAVVMSPLLYAAFSVDRRFYVPVIPLILLLSARGMINLETWFSRGLRSRLRSVWVSYVVVGVLAVAGTGYSLARGVIDSAPEHRAAGVWLAKAWGERAPTNVTPSFQGRPIVMSRKPWVAFYSNGIMAELPEGSLEDVLARVRRTQSDILVIDERWGAATRPQLVSLLDPSIAPSGLHVLYERIHPRRIVLYDVRAWR